MMTHSRLTCGYEYTSVFDRSQRHRTGEILSLLRAGENVQIDPADDRYGWRRPNTANCDWCGELFGEEKPVPGYGDRPTHRKCSREARRAFRDDSGLMYVYPDETMRETPVIDYPNGQGVFD